MKTLKIISMYVGIIILSSCSNIVYQHSMPKDGKALSSFPPKLIGEYIDQEGDTLFIMSKSYKYGEIDNSSLFEGELGEDVVLKKQDGLYFLNFKNANGYWELICGELKSKDLSLLIITSENDEQIEIINSYLKEGKAKALQKDDKYVINPSDTELFQLLENEIVCDRSLLKKIR